MKVTLSLMTSARKTKMGFPVIVTAYHLGKTKRFSFKWFAHLNEWNQQTNTPSPLHPDYDLLYPEVIDMQSKIKQINYNNVQTFEQVQFELVGNVVVNQDFYKFAEKLIAEKIKNNKRSNALVYSTAIKQLQRYAYQLNFDGLNYNLLKGFINYKGTENVKNSTIHNYLRTYRAIYNEAVARNITKDNEPFKLVFKGLKIRSHRTKKKYITIDAIRSLEQLQLEGIADLCRDLFLLQFYFGGQDLIDVYFLQTENIKHNRIFFERSKIGDRGYEFDVMIFEPAKKIIDKYTGNDYLIPGRKDYQGYRTFRRRYSRYLIKLQELAGIEVQPKGGNLGIKVARHSFANRGKRLFIEEDVLRELMGHERDAVDNYYKDRYPVEVRDAAQLKIIST